VLWTKGLVFMTERVVQTFESSAPSTSERLGNQYDWAML
jgi:hypothetical protein